MFCRQLAVSLMFINPMWWAGRWLFGPLWDLIIWKCLCSFVGEAIHCCYSEQPMTLVWVLSFNKGILSTLKWKSSALCIPYNGFIRITGFPNTLLGHKIHFYSYIYLTAECYNVQWWHFTASIPNNSYFHFLSQSFKPCAARSHTFFSIDEVNWGQQIEKIIGILASSVFFLECWMDPGCFKAVTLQPLWLNTLPWSTVPLQPTQPLKGLWPG